MFTYKHNYFLLTTSVWGSPGWSRELIALTKKNLCFHHSKIRKEFFDFEMPFSLCTNIRGDSSECRLEVEINDMKNYKRVKKKLNMVVEVHKTNRRHVDVSFVWKSAGVYWLNIYIMLNRFLLSLAMCVICVNLKKSARMNDERVHFISMISFNQFQ